MAVLLLPDGGLQGHRLLGHLHDFRYPLHRQVQPGRNLLRGWLPAQLLQKLAGGAHQAVDGFHHMDRNPYGPGLVRNSPGNGLADPPCGIGAELIPLGIIKFLHCLNKPQVSFLDQV